MLNLDTTTVFASNIFASFFCIAPYKVIDLSTIAAVIMSRAINSDYYHYIVIDKRAITRTIATIKKSRNYTKNEAIKMKSDNFTRSNSKLKKSNIAIAILEKGKISHQKYFAFWVHQYYFVDRIRIYNNYDYKHNYYYIHNTH